MLGHLLWLCPGGGPFCAVKRSRVAALRITPWPGWAITRLVASLRLLSLPPSLPSPPGQQAPLASSAVRLSCHPTNPIPTSGDRTTEGGPPLSSTSSCLLLLLRLLFARSSALAHSGLIGNFNWQRRLFILSFISVAFSSRKAAFSCCSCCIPSSCMGLLSSKLAILASFLGDLNSYKVFSISQ